jgi:ribosomal-protein-alanine N-acetyltransferase
MINPSDQTIELREMQVCDLNQLLAIEQASQLSPWTEATFARCQESHVPSWVLEQANQVIGFVFISVKVGECHILNLCISPAFQRQQLGKKLMVHALKWAKTHGAEMAYLEVRRSNVPAIKLYTAMNFKQIGERKNYYPVALGFEDALVFARDLGVIDISAISE